MRYSSACQNILGGTKPSPYCSLLINGVRGEDDCMKPLSLESSDVLHRWWTRPPESLASDDPVAEDVTSLASLRSFEKV